MLKKIAAFSLFLSAFPALAYSALPQTADSSLVVITGATYTLTSIAGTGGSVSPSRATVKAGVQKPVKTFIFAPYAGKGVQSITGSYLTNTTYKYLNALTGAELASLPAPIGVRVKVVISNVAGDANLVGIFDPLAADAGANQVVLAGTPVTLDGRLSTGAGAYSWTQVSGPATVTLSGAGTSLATFIAPATTGAYVFRLTHGTSATTTVYVSDSVAQIAKSLCVTCHAGQRVGIGVYANWSSSVHSRSIHSICSGCHVGTTTGSHPGTVNDNTVDPTTFITKVAGVNSTLAQGALFCTYCHNGNHAVPHPTTGLDSTQYCQNCHTTTGAGDAHQLQPSGQVASTLANCTPCHTNGVVPTDVSNACANCHTNSTVHLFTSATSANCVGCHNVIQKHPGNYVNDNNGIRAIVGEFSKNSHHVTGVTLTNAHCAVCHAEGKKSGASIVIDTNFHMKDNKIYLRNCNIGLTGNQSKTTTASSVSVYAWDPANPDQTLMDQFCMSCHNSAGAPTAFAALGTEVAGLGTSSATNPFGDTISNGYDQMSRGKVVGVYEQFDTGNAAHHAVRGQKYTIRQRLQLANPKSFASFSSATNPGTRKTLYEAGMFVANYTPLGASQSVGDNSTLHCGDCHTVGQWTSYSNIMADSGLKSTLQSYTTSFRNYGQAAIGAHGANNEYMLRNAYLGQDALHHQDGYNGSVASGGVQAAGGNYVCYLCHNINTYGRDKRHNGIDNSTNCNGHETVGAVGVTNSTTGSATPTSASGVATYRIAGISSGGNQGNLFGYSCGQCHNAGQQGFGGIHGRNNIFKAYSGLTDASGNSFGLVDRKPYRFMGGLSLRYNGGNAPDSGSWERKAFAKTSHDGCYNLTTAADTPPTLIRLWGTNATANANTTDNGSTSSAQNDGTVAGSWGACGHHTGTTTAGNPTSPTRTIQRPLSY
jgi:hypothetical protein